MLDLGTLQIGVKVDDATAKNELNELGNEVEDTGKKTDTLASKAKMMIKAFVAAYAIQEIVKLGKAALDAYAKFEQLEGGVQKIFGPEAAEQVMANANNAYKTAGMSANQYMETVTNFSASLIQSMEGDTEAAAKVADMAIQDMSDNANTFGTNMQSIQDAYQGFAKQNYTMLDNLKLGYGGTKQEMERLLEDAEKLSGQEYDISNLDDVYEAIHVIQEEMNVTGTTSKEASKTIEGSIGQAKAAFENLLTAIGSGEGVGNAVTQFIDTLKIAAGNILPVVIDIAKGIVVGLIQALPEMLMGIADMISNFADQMSGKNGDRFMKAGVKLITKFMTGMMKAWPKLLGAVAKLLVQLIKKFSKTDLKPVGKAIIKSLLAGFKAMWSSITSWVSSKVNWIKDKFKNAKDSAKGGGGGAGKRIGLREVPYDGYQAILHKGEAVMTAAEVNKLKRQGGDTYNNGDLTVNVYGSAGMSVDELATAVEKKIINVQKRRTAAWA